MTKNIFSHQQSAINRAILKLSARVKNKNGIALLLVLWVITLLSVICAEFSWTMRTETTITRNFKEGEQAYYTAEAGINKAILELMKNLNTAKKQNPEEDSEVSTTLWEPGTEPIEFLFEGHRCMITIRDENNKININTFLREAKRNPGKLKNLLEKKIGLSGEERDAVTDSMIDWWDKDHNITGVNGAEDEYYRSLEDPYECRDNKLPVIEDLLLIKGIDENIYFGDLGRSAGETTINANELNALIQGEEIQQDTKGEAADDAEQDQQENKRNLGLVNIFTIHSNARYFNINVNTASVEQLLLLEGMDLDTAQQIIDTRKQRKFESASDRLPEFNNYEIWKKDITTRGRRGGHFYSINARGFAGKGPVSKTVNCTVMITRERFYILDWQA